MSEKNIKDAKPGDWIRFDAEGKHYEGVLRELKPRNCVEEFIESHCARPSLYIDVEGDGYLIVLMDRDGAGYEPGAATNVRVYDDKPSDEPTQDMLNKLKKDDWITIHKGHTYITAKVDEVRAYVRLKGIMQVYLRCIGDWLMVALPGRDDLLCWVLDSVNPAPEREPDPDYEDDGWPKQAGFYEDAKHAIWAFNDRQKVMMPIVNSDGDPYNGTPSPVYGRSRFVYRATREGWLPLKRMTATWSKAVAE